MGTKDMGNQGEQIAADYVRKHGYRILAAQFHSPMGEIDLVAEQADTLVFVEVKTRRPTYFGTPAQAVSRMKQRRIVQTAYWYLQQRQVADILCRFDVIEVYYQAGSRVLVQHFENAFEVNG